MDDFNAGAKPVPTMRTRRKQLSRWHHITQVKVAGQRKLYFSAHDPARPAEMSLRVKGSDCSSELIALYGVIARLMSLALQYGAPLEKVGDLLTGVTFELCGPLVGHDRLTHCTSLPDLIGQHLLVEYCGRTELAHTLEGVKMLTDMLTDTVTGNVAAGTLVASRSDGQSTVLALHGEQEEEP